MFGASQGFELPSGDTVEPDVSFVSDERRRRLARPIRGYPPVVPELVFEVLSPATIEIDRGPKKRIYAANGVREYVLADPRTRSLEVLRATESGFGPGLRLGAGEAFASAVLAGLSLPVDEVFADL